MSGSNVVNLSTLRRKKKSSFVLQRTERLQLSRSFLTSRGKITVSRYLNLRRLPLDPARALEICELLQDVPYEAEYAADINSLTRKAVISKAEVLRQEFIEHLKKNCGCQEVPNNILSYIVDPRPSKIRKIFQNNRLKSPSSNALFALTRMSERILAPRNPRAGDKAEIFRIETEHLILKVEAWTRETMEREEILPHITIELKQKCEYCWINEPVHVMEEEMPIMANWIDLNTPIRLMF